MRIRNVLWGPEGGIGLAPRVEESSTATPSDRRMGEWMQHGVSQLDLRVSDPSQFEETYQRSYLTRFTAA